MKFPFWPRIVSARTLSFIYTLFLFSLSYLAIPAAQFLQSAGIYPFFFWGIWGIFILGGIILLGIKRPQLTLKQAAILLVIAGLYGCLYKISAYDSEKLHLVTYSVAAWIYSRKLSMKNAWGLVLIVAVLDETLQHFVPGRFFQLYDIFLNTVAGLLALGLIRTLRPAFQRL